MGRIRKYISLETAKNISFEQKDSLWLHGKLCETATIARPVWRIEVETEENTVRTIEQAGSKSRPLLLNTPRKVLRLCQILGASLVQIDILSN